MFSLELLVTSLLESLPPDPVEQSILNDVVQKTIEESIKISPSDTRKSQWEYLLKNEVFTLATTEDQALKSADTTYYHALRRILDVILTFTEHDECEQTFPFIVLQDLLEAQTIASCSHIFSWIEERSARLTIGLKPQKGKALVVLRSLNDLLRRLSKTGSTTIFCGRILTFLSGVFPLGERSGVNLRGEYGPTWEGVGEAGKGIPEAKNKDPGADGMTEGAAMQVDTPEEKVDPKLSEKKEFYNTFWSLQLPFSKPTLFADPATFTQFKDSVNKVLPVIKEATAKERAMMGSRTGTAGAALKRKREPEPEEANANEYFFAKFLTSPDLLDLEIADTHFRRQFLFQLLILLHHLLTFTKTAKAIWTALNNRALQMDFTLEQNDIQWVQETINKAIEELRQTTPNGRTFADSAVTILEREKSWVNWKNQLCSPFDKAPATFSLNNENTGLFEATSIERQKMRELPKDWPWSHGSEALTEIWEMGCRGLADLENPFQPGEVKDYIKKIKLEDHRIDMRKKALAQIAQRKAARSAAASPAPEPKLSAPAVGKAQDTTESKPSDTPTPALAAPKPTTPAASPLHPSLPAKPGSSPAKPPDTSTVDGGVSTTSATPSQPPPPAGVPTVTVSTPTTPAPIVLAPAPVPVAALSEPIQDPQILKYEENKQRWAWLALRTARDQYLQHFGKIGTGDIELLANEIEKEKQDRERILKGEEINGSAPATMGEGLLDSPSVTTLPPTVPEEHGTKTDGEDDNMEES